MALWQKLWLVFAVVWVVVSALSAFTILAFSEEHDKSLRPILLGVTVPAAAYLLAWLWYRWRARDNSGSDPD